MGEAWVFGPWDELFQCQNVEKSTWGTAVLVQVGLRKCTSLPLTPRPFPSLPIPSPHSPSEPTSQHLDPGEGSSPLENIQGLKLLKSLLQCLVLASSAH